MFSHIIGNEWLKGCLSRIIEKKKLSNSLLFAGPEGIGKSLFAEGVAFQLLCDENATENHQHRFRNGTHPDLHVYQPEGKIGMHNMAAMRALGEEVYLPPLEAKRKVFIIHHADRMLPTSANALLKTFEEPSLDAAIILISSSPELLLPTILSRCSTFHFQALNEKEIASWLTTHQGLSREQAEGIAALSQGSIGNALALLSEEQQALREDVLELLKEGRFSNYESLLAYAKKIAESIEEKVKGVEEAAKEQLLKGYCDKLTASQRESFEKEVEGIASLRTTQEASFFFEMVLCWYRDLHLLQNQGDSSLLFNKDRLPLLQQALPRIQLLPLEVIMQAIQTAKLALARSTALPLCLENFFLRLHLLS